MKKKLKILMTGPVAPPAGGISIHIQRLSSLLRNEFEIDLIDESALRKPGIFNMRSFKVFAYLKKLAAADIIFIHSGNRLYKKIHLISGRLLRKKIITTIHGYGKKRMQPFRFIDGLFFRCANKIILVNKEIKAKVPLQENKCIVRHAFLPPVMSDEPALPEKISSWIKKARTNKEIIICANASRLDMHDNFDLYGLDMSIDVANRLAKKGLKINFIFTVSSLENCLPYFNENIQLINNLALQHCFLLISEKLSFVRLIENADIVIRPTNADGDALTVREAIFLGKPTIASDVVERPAGTILFKTRNTDDLENKLEAAVRRLVLQTSASEKIPGIPGEDFAAFYAEILNSVAVK